ncbi:MAG: hypothetical protein LH615_01555 [Ferruginibacter sp.]|nr:hypothetical protein [Ferruginibacter sp.]
MNLIEEILKINDDDVLQEVEELIMNYNVKIVKNRNFSTFAGLLTDTAANELEDIIATRCKKINADDWK